MANKKIIKKTFTPLVDFSFDWIEMLEEKNLDKLFKDVQDELIADCLDIEMMINTHRDADIQLEYLVNYTSKYCYFIYHFEINEKFEHCATLRKNFLAVASTYFLVKKEILNAMVIDSVNNFRKIE